MVELAGGAGYRFASASAQGPGRNPWNPKHWTGGSSSGSGAAVAAGLVPFALGSETWGSIVCPSSYCGISGLRPTYGRVSRHGAMPLCFTLDKIGPLARTAEDLETVLDAIAGEDPADPSTLRGNWTRSAAPGRLRIGVLPDKTWDGFQKEAVTLAAAALKTLEAKGHHLVPVTLPEFPFDAVLITILASEAAASFEPLISSGRHLDLLDPLSKTGLLPGTTISAPEYVNALRRRSLAISAMAALLHERGRRRRTELPELREPDRGEPRDLVRASHGSARRAGQSLWPASRERPVRLRHVGPPARYHVHGGGRETNRSASPPRRRYQKETDWHRRRPPV